MENTYKLFKKFLPIITVLACVGLIFGVFTLLFYHNGSTVSIDFLNVIPILAALLLAISVGFCIYFTVKVDHLHILKIKTTSGFSKFATLLVTVMSLALFFLEFFTLVQQPGLFFPQAEDTTPMLKIVRLLRLFAFVPFVPYLVIGIIPKRIHRTKITLPEWLKPTSSVGALVWALLSLVRSYFYTDENLSTSNVFRIFHIVFYVLALLFLLFEIKFELFGTGHRAYMLSALVLFSYSTIVSGSITVAKFLGQIPNVTLNEFEIFLAVAFAIYALSKMFAIQTTLKHVISRTEHSERHRHHHNSHSSNDASNGTDHSSNSGKHHSSGSHRHHSGSHHSSGKSHR